MSDINEQCPFCKSTIVSGAIVCRGCRATKGRNGGRKLATLLLAGMYLMFGPLVLALGIYVAPRDGTGLTSGLIVTVFGGFLLWLCFKWCTKVTWFRAQDATRINAISEQCPFCKFDVTPGAIVCQGCGATKGRDGGRMLATLFAGGAYLLFGPLVVVLAIHSMTQPQTWSPAMQRIYGTASDESMLIFGLVVTVIGGLFMRWCIRQCAQILWFRRSP